MITAIRPTSEIQHIRNNFTSVINPAISAHLLWKCVYCKSYFTALAYPKGLIDHLTHCPRRRPK